MKNPRTLSMPFAHRNFITKPEKEIQKARRSQNNVYHQFNAKRNAGRITRYFILLRSSRLQRSIFIVGFVFLIILIAVFLILMRDSFIRFANDLKTTILRSMYSQIDASVQYLLQLPTFYSSFLGTFMVKTDLDYPTRDTAYFYASLLSNAHLSSSGRINWWKIGLPSGGLIAIVTNETFDDILWCYSSYSEHDIGSFYEWKTNASIRNESYPYANGLKTGTYNTTGRYWYEMAITTNHTTWTNLYYETLPTFSNIQSEPTFSAVSSVWESGNILVCAISLDMRLKYIQEFLRDIQMPQGSALAITSSDGFLVAVTSTTGTVFDVLDNGLIAASIQEIDEPIWKCVSRTSGFKTATNFTVDCLINKETVRFQVFQSLISFSDTINWTLHAAIRADEVYQTGEVIYNNSFVISSVVCVIICILIFGVSQLVRSFMLSEQTKLLLSQKHQEKTHVSVSGVFQAFSLLKKVSTIHSANKTVAQDAWNIANEISKSPQSLYYDYQQLLDSIENQQIKEKIMSVYDIKVSAYAQQNDENIINNNNNNNISNSNNSNNNNDSNNNDVSDQPANYRDSVFLESITDPSNIPQFDGMMQYDFDLLNQHQFIQNFEPANALNHIKAIGQNCNAQQPLFGDNEFGTFLDNTLSQIPQENLHLCADSFGFYGQFIKCFGQSMLSDQDMIISAYITLLAFHITMKDRFNQSLQLIQHFFLIEKDTLYQNSNCLLIQLSKILKNDESENLNAQRWKNIVSYVHLLDSITPIDRHIEVFQRCRLFIEATMRNRRLLHDRSIELLNFIYVTSTVSYLINSQDSVKRVQNKLVTEDPQNVFAENFLPCMNSVYIPKLMRTMRQVCGKRYVSKLTSTL